MSVEEILKTICKWGSTKKHKGQAVKFLYFTELIKPIHQQTVIHYVLVIPRATTKNLCGKMYSKILYVDKSK